MPLKMKPVCIACGAEQASHLIICERCNKPLVFPAFTCPRCGKTSYNVHDEVENYCGHCHAFVDDPPWSPAVQKAMARFHAALEARRAKEKSE